MGKLENFKIAILVADGFEQVELVEPRKALENEGAVTEVVSLKEGKVKGWDHTDWGMELTVDKTLEQASPNEYDGLLLPGGVMNPDKLRKSREAVAFVKGFYESQKPIAAICHAPWMLVEAGIANGLHLTSYSSIKTDLKNAGASWSDEEVVTDNGVVTSRQPDDIPAFNRKMIEEFAEGKHRRMKEVS